MNFVLVLALAALPSIHVVDDGGRARSIDDWRGVPTLLVPMYTRCPLACPTIVHDLTRVAAQSNIPPDRYRVVLFSFDHRDTVADLRAFREREHVPLAWTLATSSDARSLMDAIGFRWMEDRGTISHPNVVVVLDKNLQLVLSTRDVRAALDVARGGRDWIGSYGPFALALLVAVAVASAMYLVTTAMRSTRRIRSLPG